MEIIYREILKEDAEEMIRYLENVLVESDNLTYAVDELNRDKEMMEDSIIRFLRTNSVWLVAVAGDRIAGTIKVSRFDKSRTKHRASLGITVRKDFQGKGISTNLMNKAIDIAKEKEISKIELCVRKDNEIAVNLYKKFDFKIEGDIEDYFKIDNKYYNAYLMSKQI